jgi:hypothetical protein
VKHQEDLAASSSSTGQLAKGEKEVDVTSFVRRRLRGSGRTRQQEEPLMTTSGRTCSSESTMFVRLLLPKLILS